MPKASSVNPSLSPDILPFLGIIHNIKEISKAKSTWNPRGPLVNWHEENGELKYGISISDDYVFLMDSKDYFCIRKKPNNINPVSKIIYTNPIYTLFSPAKIFERLEFAILCFSKWKYDEGWNDEHFARLIATGEPISYKIKERNFNNSENIYLRPEAKKELEVALNNSSYKNLIAEFVDVPWNDAPLHFAAEKGQQELVCSLLDQGVDINAKMEAVMGDTALHRAAEKGHGEIICLLLARGADIYARNNQGQTPLNISRENVKSLLNEYIQKMEGEAKARQIQQTVLTTYQNLLSKPETFTLETLAKLFEITQDIYTFRYPYTLACLFRSSRPQDCLKIDDLVRTGLKHVAVVEGSMISEKCVALFKITLRSAFKKGILDRSQKYQLENLVVKESIFSDERFHVLQRNVQKLQDDVIHLQYNVQTLATEFDNLKSALRRKAQRDMLFGVAKVALMFVGGQAIDVLAGIADFSDLAGVGAAVLNLPIATVEEGLAYGAKKLLTSAIDAGAEYGLKKVGMHPDEFIEVWMHSALVLQSSANLPQEQISVTATYPPHPIFSQPKSASIPQNITFSQWLDEVKQEGHFTLSVSNKELDVSFINEHKTSEEIEKILSNLYKQLKKLPEMQSVKLVEAAIQNNKLIITATTTLDAKEIYDILKVNYNIDLLSTKSKLALVV